MEITVGEEIKIEKGIAIILNSNCVNSFWPPYWIDPKNEDHCQCGFKCKIKIEISRNGHDPHEYIIDGSEFKRLIKKQ